MAIHEMNYVYERLILYRESFRKIIQNNHTSMAQMERIYNIRRLRALDRGVQTSYDDIPDINEDLKDFLFQSDIVLNPDQVDALLGKKVNINSNWIISRKYYDEPEDRKWHSNEPISYVFDSSILESALKRDIKQALAFWSNHTCLSFSENGKTYPKIRFIRGAGCYSRVGKETTWLEQDISIGYGCETFAIISHMIGHTFGLWHTHARPDRDSHISIIWDEIPINGYEMERHKKLPNDTIFKEGLTEEYDYDSLMHMPEGKSTVHAPIEILANKSQYQRSMGQRRAPSFTDVLTVNRINRCLDKCSFGAICQNGGFRNPKDCDKCICPWGLGGGACQQREGPELESSRCGTTLHATPFFQTLHGQAGKSHNNTLFKHVACHWHIQAPEGKVIEIKIIERSGTCSVGCFYGGIEVKLGNFSQGGVKFCCPSDVAANPLLVASGNLTVVSVYSNQGIQSVNLQYRYASQKNITLSLTTPSPLECIDKSPACEKNIKLCTSPVYSKIMSKVCRNTCGMCVPETTKNFERCRDISECQNWVAQGFCESKVYSREDKKFFCPKSCNLCHNTLDIMEPLFNK
uniref:Zinc metalloproteinase n=1 Tax=Acrobeloides nanus TaxID=290746 RepID=A0A914CVI2_9BILA